MPLRGTMKAASVPRQRGCSDGEVGTSSRKTKARSQRQDRVRSSNGNSSNSNVKLQELKLAFCLLSREIQGLDEGGKNVPAAAGITPAVFDDNPGCATATKKPPPAVTTERVSQPAHGSGEAKEPVSCLEDVKAVSRHEDHDNLRERSGAGPSRAHKGAARNEGRKAGKAAAAVAKEVLKHLRLELDAEKKSRIAAER